MIELFRMVRNTALPATAVMAVVVLLRWVLPNFSKRARCALWTVVLVALTVPTFFHPASRFSLMPESLSNGGFLDMLSDDPIEEVQVHYPGSETYDKVIAQGDGPTWTEGVGNYVTTGPDGVSEPKSVREVTQPYLAWGWFTVMCGMAGYALASYGRLHRRMRGAESQDGLVYCGDNVTTPFILGVVRPRIYLPARMDPAERELVLAHEQAHLRRGDHLWKLVGYALLSVYWFHPLCWVCYGMFCRDIELACDEKVVREFSPKQRADYSQALLRCSAPERFALTCPLAFGEVGVKERVQNILNYKKPAFWVTVVAVVACIAAAVAFLTKPVDDVDALVYVVDVNIEGKSAMAGNFPTMAENIVIHDSNGVAATIRLLDKEGTMVRSFTSEGHGTTIFYQLEPGIVRNLEVVTEDFYVGELNYLCHGDRDCDEYCVEYTTRYQAENVTPNVVRLDEANIQNYEKLKNGEISIYDMAVALGVYPRLMERYSQIYCDDEGTCSIVKGATHELEVFTPWDFAYILKTTDNNAITPNSLAVYDGSGELQEVQAAPLPATPDPESAALLVKMEKGETTMYAANVAEKRYPTYMQPYTEIICDGDLNCTIATGGELTYEEVIRRNDILGVGLLGGPLEPNTKITYDLHGFIQNIYYEIPGKPGEYQLSPPTPAQQYGTTERLTYDSYGLELEITGVRELRKETFRDAINDADVTATWEGAVCVVYPGAMATVLNADMTDDGDFRWVFYESNTGNSLPVTDGMAPLLVAGAMDGIGRESVLILRFEVYQGD